MHYCMCSLNYSYWLRFCNLLIEQFDGLCNSGMGQGESYILISAHEAGSCAGSKQGTEARGLDALRN
jgi:hypothetical protein